MNVEDLDAREALVLVGAVNEYLLRFLDKEITADFVVTALLILFSEEEEDGRE
jgi:hypothetical protein